MLCDCVRVAECELKGKEDDRVDDCDRPQNLFIRSLIIQYLLWTLMWPTIAIIIEMNVILRELFLVGIYTQNTHTWTKQALWQANTINIGKKPKKSVKRNTKSK